MAFWLTVLQERANWLHFPIHHPPALDFRVPDSIFMLRGTLAFAFIHESRETTPKHRGWIRSVSNSRGRKFPRSLFFRWRNASTIMVISLISPQSRRFHFRFSRRETRTHFFPLSWTKSEENVCEKTFLIKSAFHALEAMEAELSLEAFSRLGGVGAASRSPSRRWTREMNYEQDTRGREENDQNTVWLCQGHIISIINVQIEPFRFGRGWGRFIGWRCNFYRSMTRCRSAFQTQVDASIEPFHFRISPNVCVIWRIFFPSVIVESSRNDGESSWLKIIAPEWVLESSAMLWRHFAHVLIAITLPTAAVTSHTESTRKWN